MPNVQTFNMAADYRTGWFTFYVSLRRFPTRGIWKMTPRVGTRKWPACIICDNVCRCFSSFVVVAFVVVAAALHATRLYIHVNYSRARAAVPPTLNVKQTRQTCSVIRSSVELLLLPNQGSHFQPINRNAIKVPN